MASWRSRYGTWQVNQERCEKAELEASPPHLKKFWREGKEYCPGMQRQCYAMIEYFLARRAQLEDEGSEGEGMDEDEEMDENEEMSHDEDCNCRSWGF